MKTIAAAFLVGLGVAVGSAQPAPATKDGRPAAAPATPAPAKKDDGKKKEEKMGKIEGMEIARGTGFIGIQIVNGVFKLTAYDAKRKPMAADFTRAALRWSPPNVKSPERVLLLPGGGVGSFTSDKIVKPPYLFRLFITLIKGDGDDAPVENFTVEFRA